MKNADMPASHVIAATGEVFHGLTKREMFAMNFMASLTKTYWENDSEYESGEALVKCQAETAIEMADALLSELEKTND
ncbi:MAG: hypothetical protein ACPGUE_11115 [Marinomonas sp.]